MVYYGLTIILSAFLLFQVQPMIGKIILPWFGGSAAVWTVCLLFFQMELLLGYLYAHVVVRYCRPRTQAIGHMMLLLASTATLPIYPGAALRPGPAAEPVGSILWTLAATVGLPYLLLSTTSPLLQVWYSRSHARALPYRLYAVSNAGSLLALLSYPLWIEPHFNNHTQSTMWSIGYAAFVALCSINAWSCRNDAIPVHVNPIEPGEDGGSIRWAHYLLWLMLPCCASTLLLATTNHLSQNVAPIPLLWVLPLSAYMLSFVLCFGASWCYPRVPFLVLFAAALFCMASFHPGNTKQTIGLSVAGLLVCCMVCHGELARLKPPPQYLTQFYLLIAAGGAAGGMLVGLVAPHVFKGIFELPLIMAACPALILVTLWMDPAAKPWFRGWRLVLPAAGAAFTLLYGIWLFDAYISSTSGATLIARNFYGSLRVVDRRSGSSVRILVNGTVVHGEEYLDNDLQDIATTYYGSRSGIGLAIRKKQETGPIRVGVVGLGVGTLASYGRRADVYRFYEINPLVLQVSRSHFHFLSRSPAHIEIVPGDARLNLEREAPRDFDVMAVDAFSGDAIPVHLLTAEALTLYFRHLKPRGILAVHVSNNYLDLPLVLAAGAHRAGYAARLLESPPERWRDVYGARWVLLATSVDFFNSELMSASQDLKPARAFRAWTDDYSNILDVLR